MLKLGIIGAENSHSHRIGEVCNIMKKVPMRVTLIWGENSRFAKASAEKGGIPEIVRDWRDMLGRVDGVMIDHRHPEPHYEAARFYIENKTPAFVDKPFTYRLREAKALIDLAKSKRTPVFTFSAKPIQGAFKKFKQLLGKQGRIHVLNSTGPADIRSRYGGIFFYGIHQVDAAIDILGTDVRNVFIHKNAANAVATLAFRSGAIATINCIKEGGGGFQWRACADKGIFCHDDVNDPIQYLPSARLIYNFLKTRSNPFSRERMLAPIAVLEALAKSLKSGKPERVRS